MHTHTESAGAADKMLYETRSLCPSCETLVPAHVVERPAGVFVVRDCPSHGHFEGIVCSDIAWWNSLPRFDVEPVRPTKFFQLARKGCPEDCGLCSSHRQMAGTAAIEISNDCNADCPVCLADNQASFELSPDDVVKAVERLLQAQDHLDVLTLSGGEPTLHPRLFEIIEAVEKFPKVGRIGLNSNGVRIARDDAFLDALAKHPKVYVNLHFDGSGARTLRGVSTEAQNLALDRLCQWGIHVVPTVIAAKGVNDHELGAMVPALLTRSESVKTVMLSMMTHTGANGSCFPGDPMDRLTIPGALDALEAGAAGVMHKRDFMPLPMPNPMCSALGYFLVDGSEITPLIPLGDLDTIIQCTKNVHFGADEEALERLLRDAIDRLYADPEGHRQPERVLSRLRELVLELFPEGRRLTADERYAVIERRIKVVYLIQFMDAWSFDSKRLCKCSCQHLLPDGQVIPSCGYYAYHRRADARFAPRVDVDVHSLKRPPAAV